MAEYINKQEMIDAIDDKYSLGDIGRMERDIIVDALTYAKTADVRPVVRGEWLNEDSASNYLAFKCSVCGTGGRLYKFPFCSQCGADMRGGDADGDEED